MKRGISALLSVLLLAASAALADSTWVYTVQISATVQSSPARVTLSWPQDPYGANSYTVYRKAKTATSWGSVASLPGSATSYVDNTVAAGNAYEYQIVKAASLGYTGYGYIYVGVDAPLVESYGKVILVVDNSQSAPLSNELARLQQDLVGDGWNVVRRDVSRTDSPANVKNVIRAEYNADPGNVKAVFLFGHVPIFRSGNLNVDGHQPRNMPADTFYGDMDGSWGSPDTIPSDIDLMVGRVDLFNMPVAGSSETELLRNYLNKDHNFRHKRINPPRRALIGNRFGDFNGEAFAASGFRNLQPFVGPGNVVIANEQDSAPADQKWSSMLSSGSYLWAYGCGGGSYTSMSGLGTHGTYRDIWSSDVTDGDAKAVFFMMFGSWLGEWDSQNNIMRAALATSTMGLTCSWAGRPHWYYHHMGVGEPIGYSARLSQNNSGLYRNQVNQFQRGVHIALMGDPTLRMHPVAPPSGVRAASISGGMSVSWTASAESVLGYHVYRASSPLGPYTRVTSSAVSATSFTDAAGSASHTYMVRAVKLENTPSGTYYNASQGAFSNGSSGGGATPSVAVTAPSSGGTVSGANVTVSATVANISSVAGVQFKLDGNNLGSEDTSAPYSITWNTAQAGNGSHTLTAVARNSAGSTFTSPAVTITVTNYTAPNTNTNSNPLEVVWFDDDLPAGGVPGASGGDSWNWISSPVYSGATAHRSTGTNNQQHFFNYATETLVVNTGDVLFAYVYLDPANPPQQVMFQWNNGSWEHRAYWGLSINSYGAEGTVSRRAMGDLPTAGQWVRLEVPAALVGLEGSTLKGMAFTLYGGSATWDRVGKFPGSESNSGSIALAIQAVPQGIQLNWNSQPGASYRVQSTTTLLNPAWADRTTVTATGLSSSWIETDTGASHRFYRIVAE